MPNFAFKDLMPIHSPRELGNSTVPLMRWNFDIPGLMEIQTPKADVDADMEVYSLLVYKGMPLSYGGELLAYDETPGF